MSIRRQGHKLTGRLGDITLQAGDELLFDCGDKFDEHSDAVKNNLELLGLVQDDHYREFMFAFQVQGKVCNPLPAHACAIQIISTCTLRPPQGQ